MKGGATYDPLLLITISNNARELAYVVSGTYNSFRELLSLSINCEWQTPEAKRDLLNYIDLHQSYFDDLIRRSELLESVANQTDCYTVLDRNAALDMQYKANKIIEFTDLIIKNIVRCKAVDTFVSYSYPQIILLRVYIARLISLIPRKY